MVFNLLIYWWDLWLFGLVTSWERLLCSLACMCWVDCMYVLCSFLCEDEPLLFSFTVLDEACSSVRTNSSVCACVLLALLTLVILARTVVTASLASSYLTCWSVRADSGCKDERCRFFHISILVLPAEVAATMFGNCLISKCMFLRLLRPMFTIAVVTCRGVVYERISTSESAIFTSITFLEWFIYYFSTHFPTKSMT